MRSCARMAQPRLYLLEFGTKALPSRLHNGVHAAFSNCFNASSICSGVILRMPLMSMSFAVCFVTAIGLRGYSFSSCSH
jgi:hypothetical protein